jgi:peptidoglycan/xylan/chitin deacetylase (PgdA/CDA1 family)
MPLFRPRRFARIAKLLVAICIYAVCEIWRLVADIIGLPKPGTIVGIFYHQVLPSERGRLAWQMAHLHRVASPVPSNSSLTRAIGTRRVFVTADDGWRSFVDNALPEMVKRGIPCTIFIIADRLGESFGERNDRIVSACELHELPSELVSIGSHTLTHPKMTTLSDEEACKELADSRKRLGKILNSEIDSFCFPFGAFDERLFELCRESGYRRAFVATPYKPPQTHDSFVVGRVRVDPSDWPIEFHLKLVGAYNWAAWPFFLKGKLAEWRRDLRQTKSAERIDVRTIRDRGSSDLAKRATSELR